LLTAPAYYHQITVAGLEQAIHLIALDAVQCESVADEAAANRGH